MPQTILREAGYIRPERSRGEDISVGKWLFKLADPAVGNIFTRLPVEDCFALSPTEGVQIAADDTLRNAVHGMYLQENLGRLSIIVTREMAAAEGVGAQAQFERRRVEEVGEIVTGLLESLVIKHKIDQPFFQNIREIADAKDSGSSEALITAEVEQARIDKALHDLRYRRAFQTADPLSE